MSVVEDGIPAQRYLQQSDLDELRSEVFRIALLASLGLATILFWTTVVPHGEEGRVADRLNVLGLVFAIGCVAWLASELRPRVSLRASAIVLVIGLEAVMSIAFFSQRDERLLYWFSLLIILSGSMLGESAIALSTAWFCAVLAYSVGVLAIPLPSYGLNALLFTAAIAIVSWLSIRPTNTALEWTLNSYRQARDVTDRLRDQQVQLVRASEQFRRANERLETINRELTRAREAAEDARRLKAQFAANVSHELRTPLHHIVGFVDMMINEQDSYGEPLPAGYLEDLEAVDRSAQHLSRLIDDVLDLSQVDAGRMGLVKEHADIAEVIHEAVGTVSGLFAARGLDLSERLEEGLPPVYMDRTRIRQVIINLLGNSVRFTERGGAVVSAWVAGGDVQVSVTDTGLGVALEDQAKIFEEFRQLDGSTSRRHEGSGLGLTICKRFVELHGGSIWVDSVRGQGSSFTFSLPVRGSYETIPTNRDRPARTDSSAEEIRDERALAVLSDDPSLARVLQRYLDGFRVIGAADAEELARVMRDHPVEAMVIASHSAEDGWERLRAVRTMSGSLPVAICPLPRRPGSFRQQGFDGHLVKPVSPEQLWTLLRSLRIEVRSALVVDDDADAVRLLTRALAIGPSKCRIASATSGEEALALLGRERPDVILVDISMPGLDGYAVLDRIRADLGSDVPVVAVTGHDDPEEMILADSVVVTRGSGLAAGELIPCLRASFNALLATPGNEPVPSEARSG